MLSVCRSARATVSFSGYVREDITNLWRGHGSELGTLSKLRAEIDADGETSSGFASVELFAASGLLEEQLDEDIKLYRAYVDLYLPRTDIRVGRQGIAWGTGILWNPTDIYSPVDALDPKKEFAGIDAVRVIVQLAELAEAVVVYAPEQKADSGRVSLRLAASLMGVDFSTSYTFDGNHSRDVVGLDMKGELGIGLWAEGAFFSSPQGVQVPRGEDREFVKVSVGADYTFPVGSGIYSAAEYFRDESGSKELTLDDYVSLAEGDRESLGREYVFLSSSYTTDDYFTLRASVIANLDDGSMVLFPTLSHRWSESLEVVLGVDLFVGEEGSEFNPGTDLDPLNLFPDALAFLWLEYGF
jgi:hypothetical protein